MENSQELQALIFNIQPYSSHDGPGLRTTVFFKGCALKCLWCANPESQKMIPELLYHKQKCCACFRCKQFCPHDAISAYESEEDLENFGFVRFDRKKCDKCENHECVRACVQSALTVSGKYMTIDEIYEKVSRDVKMYSKEGGVTLSGGDPLMQPVFVAALLKKFQENGINTALESDLLVPQKSLEMVMPYVDHFLTDMKLYDEQRHIEATGKSNKIILENLRLLGKTYPEKVLLRVPIIPTFTDSEENIRNIIAFCLENNLPRINILPYHKLGSGKFSQVGKIYEMPDLPIPAKEFMQGIAAYIEAYGIKCKVN